MSIEPQEIGGRIKAARERRGWTQVEFAVQANRSLSTVQRMERGEVNQVRELIRIAGVLGIEPQDLVELEPTRDDQIVALRGEVAELRELVAEIHRVVVA